MFSDDSPGSGKLKMEFHRLKTEVGSQNEGFKKAFSDHKMAENISFSAKNFLFSGFITPVRLNNFSQLPQFSL